MKSIIIVNMDTLLQYTVSGLIETSKLLVRGLTFLVTGKPDMAVDIAVIKIDGMDIDTKLALVDKFVADYPDNKLVLDIGKVVVSLRNNLIIVQQAITDHNAKWFVRYRTFDITIPLMNLEKDVTILTERLRYIMFYNNPGILADMNDSPQ